MKECRDDELFATAGVSRCIKVFDFSSVVNEPADIQCPISYKSSTTPLKYSFHELCNVITKVKVWCTRQEESVLNIDMKANICCVKYNPGSGNFIAVGSADHHIYHYDLRNISQPLHVFSGHKKAVSYVKFLSNNELASASTDSTLRLWDVKDNLPVRLLPELVLAKLFNIYFFFFSFQVRTFRGHTNEKNFVGLTMNSEYLACGSETNEVYVYHKEITRPVTSHRFGTPEMDNAEEEAGSYFISAVCWKSDSPTMLTANSQGTIKVLVLAA
ncbi:unnamed protein product [Brassica rapa subsp. narinosa]